MSMIDYHLGEIEIARDSSNPKHAQPPFSPRHKQILDVGCGMGQTLIAADLPSDVMAYGIDRDRIAIESGQRLAPHGIELQVASGESLPFSDCQFDLVISRVALPYMNITNTLREMERVLKPGGDLWLMLHSLSMNLEWLHDAARNLQINRMLSCCYVLANGYLFNHYGYQLSIFGHGETYQTTKGIRRALTKAGFEDIDVEEGSQLLVNAIKS